VIVFLHDYMTYLRDRQPFQEEPFCFVPSGKTGEEPQNVETVLYLIRSQRGIN